ncbi:MAG: hypothetical protein NZ902_03135 [Acidilobaceae archaeon]|nr:hypothetical protein [Acidilobaceae archaeon]MCX8165813.1 hypothetical protein [Acidilobaceae archaeon]MDW7974237.1 hypothetical protein [Sulfolobales archaeon]
MRFQIAVPAVLLGVPIPGSENPVIVAPIGELEAEFSFWDCQEPKLEGREELAGLWQRAAAGLGLKLCARVDAHRQDRSGNEYFALSAGLLYALYREHGERLSASELVEMAGQLVDVADPSWRVVYEALWYSAHKGSSFAYRNLEEAFELDFRVKASVRSVRSARGSRIFRDLVGEELYGAVVHLMGSAVLEASLRLREGQALDEVIEAFAPIHDGIASMVWGLPPEGDCLWSPATYNSFSLLCLEERGEGSEV